MAAVSEVKSTRIIQSYVSSNHYYGYVPPINETIIKQNNYQQIDKQYSYNSQSQVYLNKTDKSAYFNQQQQQQQQNNGNNTLAMETDDVDNLNGDNLHCQNNHYVIPEMVKRLDGLDNNLINTRSYCGGDPGSRGTGDSVGLIYRVTHSDADADADADHHHHNNNNNNNYYYYYNNRNTVTGSTDIQRRNRKRNNYEHDGAEADGFQNHGKKKFRPDGGNKRVCRETRICTRDSGPSAMHNEPATCLVTSSVRSFPIQSQVNQVNKVNDVNDVNDVNHHCNDSYNPNWVQPPGNSSEPYPIQCETRVICDSTRINKENLVTRVDNLVDYEMMLMETHGCSAYHLHRHQLLDIDTFDTEF
ncbi:GATA zinc finger domain-containing protein 14-like [Microplitis mediator]|uniref:GATA zinc finger domain-containing protein 14-like n=1 Tax=Microplitis mediator TaxID=375433 RepID=UPI002553DD87|nr:GATA zinc finger domain-containing protein 14-like [Microplitis mediator]